ncbi:hypothetical protein HMPREF3218_0200406 [Prevotella bivia]|nr:hypothetical protein HMPREF3218_0200406 [Prevotella bivia]
MHTFYLKKDKPLLEKRGCFTTEALIFCFEEGKQSKDFKEKYYGSKDQTTAK